MSFDEPDYPLEEGCCEFCGPVKTIRMYDDPPRCYSCKLLDENFYALMLYEPKLSIDEEC